METAMSSETKLRAMRHRDIWHVVNCETTAMLKGGGLDYAMTATDLEYYQRQQYHRLTVAADCHGIPRGYMHADCGTGQNFARIKRIVTHGDWWGMGIARQLLCSFLGQCKDAQVDCYCDVPFSMLPAAANFLKRFGFKGTGSYSLNGDEYVSMAWHALTPRELGVPSCR